MKSNLIKSSFSGGLQLIISTIIVFVTIPIFIKELGTELYGIFSLLLLIGNLNVFVNAGLNTSLIKFLSEQGKTLESNYDIIVSLLIMIFLSIPILVLALYFKDFILTNILNISNRLLTKSVSDCYSLLLVANIFILIGQISTAVLDSQQKIYLTNFFQMIYNIFYWGFILISLKISPSLSYIGISILLATVIWYLTVTITALNTWGKINLNELRLNFGRVAKKQLKYSSKIYLSGTINFFYEPLTKIMISYFIGIKEVGIFDIAQRVRNQIWSFISKMIYPVYPVLSESNEPRKIRLFIHDFEQKIAFLILPLIASVLLILKNFVHLWIGTNIQILAISINILILGNVLSMMVLPNYLYLLAKGHAGKTVIMQSLNVLVNLIIFFLLYPIIGYYAVLAGNFLAVLSSFSVCLYYQYKYFNSLIFNDVNQFNKFIFVLFALFVLGIALNFLPLDPLLQIFIILLTIPLTGTILYRWLSVFTLDDIQRYSGDYPNIEAMAKKLFIK